MPLDCDCYGGCWGDHSEIWPRLKWPAGIVIKCREGESVRQRLMRAVREVVPYGSYVNGGRTGQDDMIRLEKEEYVDAVLKEIMNETV